MLETCLIPNLLQFKTTTKHIDSVDGSSVPIKKRHVTSDLPLKKRYHRTKNEIDVMIEIPKLEVDDDFADEDDKNLNSPVDFSLPNRSRAICHLEQKIANNDLFRVHSRIDDGKISQNLNNSNELMLRFSDYLRHNLPPQVPSWPTNDFFKPFSSTTKCNNQHSPHSTSSLKFYKEKSKIKSSRSNHKKCDKFSFVEPQSLPVERYSSMISKKVLKNMTTERRMEANARERTRVHTISAAFDNVRKLLPCFSCDQKLSKLSILRLACNYIMLLASMNDADYSADERNYTIEECIEIFTETSNVEAKLKKY